MCRCHKCFGFNHEAKTCRRSVPDLRGEHTSGEYDIAKIICRNCVEAVEKYGITVDTKHKIVDEKCPSYQKRVRRIRQRTNYNNNCNFL